jgi:Tfp pilus assembly protein PilF
MIAQKDQRRTAAVVCLVLAAMTFAVFGQTLHHQFIDLDDNAYVFGNPVVARGLTPEGIIWAFTHFHSFNWHPLTWLSHELDCQIWGLQPGGHHLTNVLLHTATVLALFLVLRQMTGAVWRSAFVAAVFAIHPLRVESVAWIAERKDVLSGLFFMLTLAAYIRYVRSTDHLKSGFGLVFLLFACGLMCKPMLVTLPLVLLLLDYWPLNRWQVREERAPASPITARREPRPTEGVATPDAAVGRGSRRAGDDLKATTAPQEPRPTESVATPDTAVGRGSRRAGDDLKGTTAPQERRPTEGVATPDAAVGRGSRRAGDDLKATTAPQEHRPTESVATPDAAVGRGSRRAGDDLKATTAPQEHRPTESVATPDAVVGRGSRRAGIPWSLFLEKLPLFALSAASCLVTIFAQHSGVLSTAYLPLPHRLANAALSCVVYLRQMVWPAHLAPYYPFPHVLFVARVAVAVVLLTGASIVAWRLRRSQPWLLAGWLWYLVMLLPVVGIMQVGEQAHADRYTYLPQIGIYVALTWLLGNFVVSSPDLNPDPSSSLGSGSQGRRELAAVLGVGVLAALMFLAWKQTACWLNSETVATHALGCTADNYIAHTMLGNALMRKGESDAAIAQFREALRVKATYADARNNLGNALEGQGKLDEAVACFKEVLKTNPNYAVAHYNLGVTLCIQGKEEEGIAELRQAVKINPSYAPARNNLGIALCKEGRVEEGIAQFRQALQTNPSFFEAYNSLGLALMQQGKTDEAIACYRKALAISPSYQPAQINLQRAILQK